MSRVRLVCYIYANVNDPMLIGPRDQKAGSRVRLQLAAMPSPSNTGQKRFKKPKY
jgi:hypothetical protein